ncbi:alcohol dehydrogenase catalytic domain-containing protein [Streptomyces sp. NPDC001890]|uniref:alcohol dehydrogenase catalytic domain-containing protein n=1 Tax=Streptomyces sp. NPDC001890 TaxID=3364620 RepID=UPI00369B7BC8
MSLQASAAVYREGTTVTVETIEVGDPRAGEVRVRVHASGICGSDRHVLDGEWHVPSPTVMGHEGAGVVEAVGPGVTHLAPGDHVVLVWNQGCELCSHCLSGRPWACRHQRSNDCLMPDGTTRLHQDGTELFAYIAVGSLSEYAVVPASAAIKVPEELPFEVGALIGCSVATGVGAVLNNARVAAGSSAVVIGCGGVGLSVVMGLRLAGAEKIIAVDVSEEKVDLARKLGATHTVLAGDDSAQRVIELTGGGADYCFEAIGNPRTIAQVPSYLGTAGTGVFVGMPPEGVQVGFDVLNLCYSGQTLIASNYGGCVPARDFPRYAALYLSGQLPVDRLITERIKLDEVNAAFERMRGGEGARNVVML